MHFLALNTLPCNLLPTWSGFEYIIDCILHGTFVPNLSVTVKEIVHV